MPCPSNLLSPTSASARLPFRFTKAHIRQSYLLYPTPFRDEQCHCGCHSLDTFNTHPLIKTVNLPTDRSIHHRRDFVIEAVDTGIDVGG